MPTDNACTRLARSLSITVMRCVRHSDAMRPTQRLRINIRSTADFASESFDDEFYFGSVTSISVPTKAQSIAHLKELVKKYYEWIEEHPDTQRTDGDIDAPTFKMDMLKLSELSQKEDDDHEDSEDVDSEDDESVEDNPPQSKAVHAVDQSKASTVPNVSLRKVCRSHVRKPSLRKLGRSYVRRKITLRKICLWNHLSPRLEKMIRFTHKISFPLGR